MALKTVITFGTYDLFHVGHLRLLERARALGDRLVVGVSTDALNIAKKKFSPSIPEKDRIDIIRALRCVDEAFYEESLEQKGDYIRQYKADILVMGHDWEGRFDHFRDLCEVVYLPRTEGVSTTQIREDTVRRGFITYS